MFKFLTNLTLTTMLMSTSALAQGIETGDFDIETATVAKVKNISNGLLPTVAPAPQWQYQCEIVAGFDDNGSTNGQFANAPSATELSVEYNATETGGAFTVSAMGGVTLAILGYKTGFAASSAEIYDDNDPEDTVVINSEIAIVNYEPSPEDIDYLLIQANGVAGTYMRVPGDSIHPDAMYTASKFVPASGSTQVADWSDAANDPLVWGNRTMNEPDLLNVYFDSISFQTNVTPDVIGSAGYGLRVVSYVQCSDRAEQPAQYE